MELLSGILFIDIETVPEYPNFEQLSDGMQIEWARKAKFIKVAGTEEHDAAGLFAERAGIFSEFAKIVCISIGSVQRQEDKYTIRLKSFAYDDEKKLLSEFCEMISKFSTRYKDMRFCGHNIKEFDLPFICRRMVINAITLPDCMQLAGKKPWEVSHIDTMELWKFGDHKHFTSLSLLAQIFGIPTPKGDIDGSMVASVYWNDNDLARISTYCQKDVLTTARVYMRLKGITLELEEIYV